MGPKEGVLRIFFALKIRRLRPGLNPRTWVPEASTLPLDHWSHFDPTFAPFFTFFAPYHVTPIASASCSKQFLLYSPCVSSYLILSLLYFPVSHLPAYSTPHHGWPTLFILDLTFCVLHFNFLLPYRTSFWSSVFLFTKIKCTCVDWMELAERHLL
jgi:hypothetical protein